ncbi:hypothetical protein VB712_10660 [Spirulina sp. CCNP1310]|uniref:hypothetical protein n=1 Tax=Spirulina sp. CCNP1310 TaxID=3110249 RepID=UPI002B20D61D|nr:hypothetical protein [Spirulina sp. CCNP1310]MEA5419683.1 hypothetical protein [Spirulina sp. CCNP1310]
MRYLIYPTLDHYRYDLRHGLGQTQQEILSHQTQFIQTFPPTHQATILAADTPFEIEYLELLGNTRILKLFPERSPYAGYLYPVRLNDTYSLLIDCSTSDRTTSHHPQIFTELQQQIQAYTTPTATTLGQTSIASAILNDPQPSAAEILDLAQQIYQTLYPQQDWQTTLTSQGRILNGYFFELSQHHFIIPETHHSGIRSAPNNHHILIILYPNLALVQEAGSQLIEYWLRLWCYRNKMLWAYQQSRYLKQALKQKFSQIIQYVAELKNQNHASLNLNELEAKLNQAGQLFAEYGIELTELDYQTRTIEINSHNYQQCLSDIQEKLSQFPAESNLTPLMAFLQQPFLAQLQKDSENLRPGLDLLQFNVNLIQADLELKRTRVETIASERDRTFQTRFAIWGTAIALGSIITSVSAQFPTVIVPAVIVPNAEAPNADLITEHPLGRVLLNLGVEEMWLAPGVSLLFTLLITLICGSGLSLIVRLLPGPKHR